MDRRSTAIPPKFHTYRLYPAPEGLFLRAFIPVLSSEQTSGRASYKVHWSSGKTDTRGELVVVVFFVLAIAIVGGFLTVALTFPELLPWYSNPSPRSSPPASTFWEESVA